jgi:hypothetical protein
MPPSPVEHARKDTGAPLPGFGSVNAYGEHGVAIGNGTFHDFVVGTVNRYDGRDR